MASTLRDVLESRAPQRPPGVRRDAAETGDAVASRREPFSLDEARQPAGRDARATPSSIARSHAVPSRAGTADAAAARPTRPGAAASEAAGTDKTRPDRSGRPDASAPEQPGTAKASETARPAPAVGAAKAVSGRPALADRTSAPRAGTTPGEPTDASAPTSESVAGEPPAATGEGRSDEAAVANPDTASSAAAMPMMAIFTAPPPPIAPAGPAGGAGEEGEAGIVTTDLAASGAGDLAATSPARGAKPATPGFEAALTEIASDGPGLDAAKVELMQPSEASATAGGTTALTAPAEAKAATAPQQTAPASAPVPLGAVPMTIGLRALGSSNRFEIRLDPKELGRIDVSIDIDKDTGTVGARLVVDRPETLALLQRDASSLQQALAQTGLDASAGISLSLRSGGEDQRHDTNADAEAQGRRGRLSDSDGSEAGTDHSPVDLVPLRALRGLGRVDIRI